MTTGARSPLQSPQVMAWLREIRTPVAVTGGTGFVGSHLVDLFCAAGLRPRVLVRDSSSRGWIDDSPVEWVEGRLQDPDALRTFVAGAGTVYHLAGAVRAGTERVFDSVNRVGTASLVAAVRTAAPDAKLVYLSSIAAAGPSPTIEGVGPEVAPKPVSAYGRSKLGGENEVAALAGDRPWLILRPPAIYGPRDRDILQFFRMAATGWVALPRGEMWASMAYVGDIVACLAAAGARGSASGRVLHLGEERPYRLRALARLIGGAAGRRVRIVSVPAWALAAAGVAGSLLQRMGFRGVALTRDKAREMTARHWTCRTVDSLAVLGVGSTTSFPEGAAATWDWYRRRAWVR
jgi:nucleoside-diphosphate-sugar epimerase